MPLRFNTIKQAIMLSGESGMWYFINISSHGAVAQLGERLNGIQEVVGSIPISSTINYQALARHLNPLHLTVYSRVVK